jgi:hypothetical protein
MTDPRRPRLKKPRQLQHVAYNSVRFEWEFQHPEAGKTQTHVYIRRKALPSGTYEYWNGTTWQSGETFVSCTTQYIDINTGWTAGTKYQWSCRVRDNSGNTSGYADDLIKVPINVPTVTVLQPVTTATTSRPTVTWDYTQTQGYQQLRYRVAIYTAAVFGSGGFTAFDPAYSAHMVTDWITSSTDWSYVCDNDLTNGVSYRAYVQVETEGGLQSAIAATATWTASLNLPAAPTISTVVDQDLAAVRFNLSASFNLLTDASSSFDDGTVGTWTSLVNATLASSTDFAAFGSKSMKVTSAGARYSYIDTTYTTYTNWQATHATYSAATNSLAEEAGTMRITTPTGLSGIPVVAGQTYSAFAKVRKATGSANVTARIAWFKSDGSASAITQYSTIATVSAGTSGWTDLSLSAMTAPADAAFAALQYAYVVAGAGEAFYMDQIAFSNSTNAAWSPGSTGSGVSFVIERSEDDGATWTGIHGYTLHAPGPGHHPSIATMTDYDRAAGLGLPRYLKYRAYTVSGSNVASAVGEVTIGSYLKGTGWWLRDPLYPELDMRIAQIELSSVFNVPGEAFYPEGRDQAVVVQANAPLSEMFNIVTWTQTDDEFDNLMTLLRSKHTLLVQSMTHGQKWYVRVNGQVSYSQVMAVGNGVNTVFKPLYKVSASVVEVAPMIVGSLFDSTTSTVSYYEVAV